MKKITVLFLCIISFVSLQIRVFAKNESEIMTYYNNVSMVNTSFTIDENGLATVVVLFTGYEGITTGATITTKIQKKIWPSFWMDIPTGTEDNLWVDEVTGDNCYKYHTCYVSKGTYRVQVQYEIRGIGGASDIFTEEIERTYK